MSTPSDSQKFIAVNRAPRVQIEYDVELYGAQTKVELPLVMAVMADLSGQSDKPALPIAERKFVEIDVDNFDERMAAIEPRITFDVPNTISGQGQLPVELRFRSLEDFSPSALARQVQPLHKLLELRAQLAGLLTYMDGKAEAERSVSQLLADPARLARIAERADTQTDTGTPQDADNPQEAP